MKYSNKLNLLKFFNNLSNEKYVIVKLNEDFPNYYFHSDIDIFCINMEKFSKKILQIGNQYAKQNWNIKIKSTNENTKIDFYYKNQEKLDFRFDIFSTLPKYKKIKIKPGLFYSIIENQIKQNFKYKDKEIKISIPSEIDDLILRYYEFIEYYEQRPDKIKHLEIILKKIEKNEKKLKKMIEKIHLYTKLIPLKVPPETHFARTIVKEKKITETEKSTLKKLINKLLLK